MQIIRSLIFLLAVAIEFRYTVANSNIDLEERAQNGENDRKCSNGEHQENSKVICEEWFFYPDNRHCTGDACQPTSAMISWMRSRGYTDLTKKGACEVTNAPWPLYNNNAIRVAGVCQAICNWCPDGHAPLATGPTEPPTTTVKPVTEDPNAAKYFVASGCPTANDLNEGQYIPPSTKAGVMCCKQPFGSGCVSEGNCNVNAKTLQGAIFTCFIHGLRLCTRSELLSNICCGLNVHCDKVPVWSSTEEGDPCDPNPCANSGICSSDGTGGYSCDCSETLFTGVNCTIPPTPCAAHSDCSGDRPFCFYTDNGTICTPCAECHYCNDGADGTCGPCGEGFPTREDGPCAAPPTCDDGIINQGETGVDCGGPCPACLTCDDGIMNQGETGIDCGGPCPSCPTCDDGIMNQGETGIDCGGPCPACLTCDDGMMNQGETGIDCGGPCPACPSACSDHSDCPSGSFCHQNHCDTCDECKFCSDGVGGTCGACNPTMEQGPCEAPTPSKGYPSTAPPGYPSTAQPGYPSTAPPTTPEEPCEDTSPKCPRFVPKYCTKNKMVMENCKASCGFCKPPTTPKKYPSTPGSTTGYPSTAPTTAAPTTVAPTTAAPTTGYPSTPKISYPSTGPTTGYPSTPLRRLCSARTMNKCRCGCKNAGPPEPKIKCNKKQKKNCPCKCNNL